VQESTFLGSFRRTLVRTADGSLVRLQHSAGDRVEFDEAVHLTIDAVPVSVRPAAPDA
jgi:putative spermidine/putrescine transport system ATP-binding protein